MGWNEAEGKYNWELVFCTLYASGKYNSDNYSSSLGTNGLGATATQYTSEFMIVESIREGQKYIMNFEEGRPVGELKTEDTSEESGTTITFKPDRKVFTDIGVSFEFYVDLLRRQAMLNKDLELVLKYHDTKEIILAYKDGTAEFLNTICEKNMTPKIIKFEGSDIGTDEEDGSDGMYKVEMTAALTFSRESKILEMYHNGGYLMDGGASYDGMASGIVKACEEQAKKVGKINKNDKILFKDIEEILCLIGTTQCPAHRTSYKHQTKTAITNKFIKKSYGNFMYKNMIKWFNDNINIADRIIDEILLNQKARESAEAVKKRVIKKLHSSIEGFQGRPDKFTPCSSNNPAECEVYIVEGDSAAGSCKRSREPKFQAIMPIRGKMMNCLKEDLTRILGSGVIIDLVRIIGCGIEAKSKYVKDLPPYDYNKLNYHKIIICTDADLDGMQIRCLILTMLYRIMPSVIKAGHVYIAETPLFEITAKGNSVFAYSEEEKDQIIKDLINNGIKESSIKIQRSKGLGENDPDMMHKTTMSPLTRRLVPVEFNANDEKDVGMIFTALLGDDIESRRYLIEQYFDLELAAE